MNRSLLTLFFASFIITGCISEEEHQEVSTDLKTAKESLSAVQEKLDGLGKQIEEKDLKITEMEEQVKILTEQNNTFTEKQPKLEQEVADLQKELDAVKNERDEIKTASSGSTAKMKQLGDELASAKADVKKWQADHKALQGSNDNLKSRLNDLENRPREDILFSNSLVRFLRQKKKTENASLAGRDDLSEEEQTTFENNKKLLAKSNKDLTTEMGDYYSGKGTLEQMAQKYPDFAKKYQLIQKMRVESSGGN